MDDVYTRARYSRYSGNVRRRRKTGGGGFAEKVIKQVFISVLVLSVVWYIKSIDSPISSHVINGVKWVVEKSVEPKMIYDSIKNVFKREPSTDDTKEAKKDGKGSEGVPAGNVLSSGVQKDYSPSFILPLDGYIAVPFGEREHQLTKAVEFHCGVDIAVKEKVEVLAAAEGHIVEIGNKEDNYGLYLKIDHGKGWQTVYGHCSEIMVNEGDKVKQGDLVAIIKAPAGTLKQHLHFEIWKDEMPVDPVIYLEEDFF